MIKMKATSFNRCSFLVLDEADRVKTNMRSSGNFKKLVFVIIYLINRCCLFVDV